MESAAATSGAHGAAPGGAVLVLAIVGSAVLCGIGMLGMAYWLITLRWLFFASVVPLVVGAYLLFTRTTGADHA
jgi:uncharacterized protein (DUF983 family)